MRQFFTKALFIISFVLWAIIPNTLFAQQADGSCIVDGNEYPDGWSKIYYSSMTSEYPGTCSTIASTFSCTNWSFLGDKNDYPYETCLDGVPTNCTILWTTVPHSLSVIGYSQEEVSYPKTCEQVSAPLKCNNGFVIGNQTLFKYPNCEVTWWLVDGLDLILSISYVWSSNSFAQYASPALQITITNRWTSIINAATIASWFLTCSRTTSDGQNIGIYESRPLEQLTINPWTSLKRSIVLKDIITQSLWDKNISCEIKVQNWETNSDNNKRSWSISVIKSSRFDIAMDRSIKDIKQNLDAPEILGEAWINPWAESLKNFLIKKVMDVAVPLIITLGILIAILWFYKLLFSSEEKAIGEWVKYISYWLIWIVLIMSAKFIANTLYTDVFNTGILWYGSVEWYQMAQKLYENLLFPFIKMAMYIVLGVLFVILLSRTISFVFGSDEDTRKKSWTIIVWNVLGMIIIIGAKQVIEFIYWKQADVVKAVSNLWEIGTGILANKNLPLIYEIVNWAMGLAALVILIMVLVQAFQLLIKPDSPDSMKKIKNSLLYIFIGIVIIGTWYIITNFLIIN